MEETIEFIKRMGYKKVGIASCVGLMNDTLFLKHSQAPTTVMVVKDRVLGHNPVMALYTANTMYSRFKKELNIK